MDWVRDEDYGFEEVEEKWDTNPWTGWTVFSNVYGTELWFKFQFIGKFESKEDAFDHVKGVGDINA